MLRHAELLALCALLFDAHDLWNHVARALNHHFVADLETEPLNLVLVMQRGARHRHAAHLDRPQVRHRRQRARAANLHFDRFHRRHRLPRRILIRNRPARRLRR